MNIPCQLPFARKQCSGFTLLELMIVLAIAAILAGLAGPSFQNTIQSTQVVSLRNNLADAIKQARAEAVYNKTPVTICASNDQSACRGANDWRDGWILFIDDNSSGSRDAGERLIEVNYGNNKLNVSGLGAMTFAATGVRTDGGGTPTLSVCSTNTSIEGKGVTVALTGSVTYTTGVASGCP